MTDNKIRTLELIKTLKKNGEYALNCPPPDSIQIGIRRGHEQD